MSSTPDIIQQLVDRFENDAEHYRGDAYNETLTRVDFINPMFKALGWDMDNTQGYADAYRDVIHEDAIKIGGETKAPDYCFRIGGTRKFFLEAKKPGVNIRKDPAPAFQLRRYAWSAKLPLSILTDFEEFAVYDCRVKPHKFDKPSTARVFYCTYDQYVEKWPEIAGIFARESILKGSFDKYAETTRKKRGTAEVDEAFLSQIETFRELLARNIALRNRLSQRDLNFAVQRTIDRIIFLRICEDRGIEVYANLRGLLNGPKIYKRLCELYNRADERYNSGLFHFHKEKDRHEAPDELTPSLDIDDKVLKEIISSLYYPDSPYEFSVLGADILGQVYEQFLGKVIHLTPGGRAKIEEKPEVRKAGGVYYTPTYIVDYIVANTVGKLVEGKTPREVAKIRVLDPACGSGSFLIGAYHFLLDWHLKWYIANDPESHAKGKKAAIYQGKGGWRLTTAQRKRILLNNIYGVDIDNQAVEVTKLSLLLKVLEGETGEGVNSQLRLFHERALPDLGDNIKCGNSLIGPDFYDNERMLMLDEEEKLRINVFDWNKEFAPIMKAGGFDAVIGNPPYLFITEVPAQDREYYQKKYEAVDYRFDLYGAFIEKSTTVWLDYNGLLGFIIPHTLLSNDSFRSLRSVVANKASVYEVVDMGPGVFPGAKNETMLLFLRQGGPKAVDKVGVIRTSPRLFPAHETAFEAVTAEWASREGEPWLVHATQDTSLLIKKMAAAPLTLGQLTTINQGLRTGNNRKYLAESAKSRDWKPAAGGKHIARYRPIIPEVHVLYDPDLLDAPRKREIFESKRKLVVQEIRNISLPRRIVATADCAQVFCLQSTNVINRRINCPLDLWYLLGILNSEAVNLYFRVRFPGNNHIPSNQLARIPIAKPTSTSHDRMVALVDQMLKLHERLAALQPGHEREALQRQIDATDAQIDRLVYDLYGLTDEEIRIVEEATG